MASERNYKMVGAPFTHKVIAHQLDSSALTRHNLLISANHFVLLLSFCSDTPSLPMAPGGSAQILMLCQPHQFKLAVNGCHLLEFRHRVQDLSSIDQLEIMGDLELSDVKLW
jgi:hypothetical protein